MPENRPSSSRSHRPGGDSHRGAASGGGPSASARRGQVRGFGRTPAGRSGGGRGFKAQPSRHNGGEGSRFAQGRQDGDPVGDGRSTRRVGKGDPRRSRFAQGRQDGSDERPSTWGHPEGRGRSNAGRSAPRRLDEADSKAAAGGSDKRRALQARSAAKRPSRGLQPAQGTQPRRGSQPARGTQRTAWRDTKQATAGRNWGGVARRGIGELNRDEADIPSSSALWRQAVEEDERRALRGTAWEPDETWVIEPESPDPIVESRPAKPARPSARAYRDLAVGKEGAPAPGGRRRTVPRRVVDEVVSSAGKTKGEKLAARIADATYSYEKERYADALRVLRQLVGEVPGSASVWELYGLTLYRSGNWAQAASALETFKELSGSYDQHPVLADCYRALRRYDDAEQMWVELREASPSGDVVAEGRIVAAGVKADRGDLAGAILMLEKASRKVAKPADRHLRQWYALADLYERAGDLPRARDLFNRVASIDADAFDVRSRLRALR